MKSSKKVLIVEDDLIISRLVGRLIKNEGHTPVAATSFNQAAKLLEISKFDLITLDLRLPDKHGNILLKELVRRNLAIPVIIISGNPEELVATEQVRAVVTKPFLINEFLQALRQQLGQ
jgi:DNA-binding NtrC family response regulator